MSITRDEFNHKIERLEITQSELAEKTGYSRSYINDIIKGKRNQPESILKFFDIKTLEERAEQLQKFETLLIDCQLQNVDGESAYKEMVGLYDLFYGSKNLIHKKLNKH